MGEMNRKRGRKAAPRLEALEDRSLLSVTPLDGVEVGLIADAAPEEGEVKITRGIDEGAEDYVKIDVPPSEEEILEDPALIDPNLYIYTFLPPEASQRSLDGEEPVYKEEDPFAVPAIPEGEDGLIYYTLFTTDDVDGTEVLIDPAAEELPIDSPLIYMTMGPAPSEEPAVTAPDASPSNDTAVADALTDDAGTALAPEAKATPEATTPREQNDGSTGYRGPAAQPQTPNTSDDAAPADEDGLSFTVETSF
jgi:hypothetical protein